VSAPTPDRSSLAGRVALVTGGARGIGFAVALALAEAGATLELGDVDGAAAAAAASALPPGADAVGRAVDVADGDQVRAWVADVAGRRGRIDVLVNNAGIQLNRAAVDLDDEDWHRVLGVNLDGAFRCSREVGRVMRAQGSGAIVNISSIADRFGMPRRLPYGVTKAGISALTRGLAAEWAPDGIRVNAVAPGYVETDLVRHAFEMGHIDRDAILAKIPLGRLAEPRSIGDAVAFLASDRADYLTGQTLYVDGGYTISK
jgi:NAD(P)-dependent dehydrogenase (short-subunit alcohol dehydrogenase family)